MGGWTCALGARLLSFASIATLPEWMRKLGHFDRPGLVDMLVRPAARVLVRLFSLFGKCRRYRRAETPVLRD
ncbi:hypothetical protein [Nocardia niigatensis]|uniref:hypothetical protein n=1 Tax=Nocardia niigatensis TaxID=209249 RepID=UPI00031F850D|nr:hypothetical protein [Nocardia niigatensis]